jgi:hypothetical protein
VPHARRCAYGTPEDRVARLERYVAGVRHFVFEPLCPSEEMLQQIEALVKEVTPLVRV